MARFVRMCIALIILKNIMIRKREWFSTLYSVIVPTIPFIILQIYLHKNEWTPKPTPECPEIPGPIDQHGLFKNLPDSRIFLAYSPKNNFTDLIMTTSFSYLNQHFPNANIKLIPSTSENNMINLLNDEAAGKKENVSEVGVVFDLLLENNFTTNLKYKIRTQTPFKTNELSPSTNIAGRMNNQAKYITGGFMFFQLTIDQVFIELIAGKNSTYQGEKIEIFSIEIQEFPRPYSKGTTPASDWMLAWIRIGILFGLTYIPLHVVHKIMAEKKNGIKELMKTRGINDYILWASWQMYVLMVYTISVTCITGYIKFGSTYGPIPLRTTDITLLWSFFILQVISTVSFFYFFAMAFAKPFIALLVVFILWIVAFLLIQYQSLSHVNLMFTIMVFPVCTVNLGIDVMKYLEYEGVGAQWSNLFDNIDGVAHIPSMGIIFIALICSTAFYYALSWYMGCIKPGPYGRAKPWHFIFQVFVRYDSVGPSLPPDDVDLGRFEKAPNNLNVYISIQNLRKTFNRGSLVAVDNVTMDIYEGTITAFLGQNGAGKTTMMNIITGMFSPTSGEIYYNGNNIFVDVQKFRDMLGICPQEDLLFPELDCIQHLIIFGMIQGLSYSTAKAAGKNALQIFNLTDKKHTLAKQLSRGMKRKLSLALSLTGEPNILILDQPTSGLDPESRREVWNILLGYRGNRTILITSHLMEEADILSDRVAIMDHGIVHCYGSPLFLKRIYGSGFNYKLTILKDASKSTAAINSVVSNAVPGCVVNLEMSTNVTYSLPTALANNFPALLKKLEADKSPLGITGISIAFKSLEDVFISVAQKATPNNGKNATQPALRNVRRQLRIGVFKALMKKRIIRGCRNWYTTLCFVLITLLFTWSKNPLHFIQPGSKTPPLTLQLSSYGPTTVLFKTDDDLKAEIYQNLITKQGSKPVRMHGEKQIAENLVELSEAEVGKYRVEYLVAAEFDEHKSKSLYASAPYHTAPISLSILSNTLCKVANINCSITTTNHPLTDVVYLCRLNVVDMENLAFLLSQWFGIGLLVQIGQCIAVPLSERVNNVKQLQIIAGVAPWTYWLTFWLYDYTLHVLIILLMLSPIFIFSTGFIFSHTSWYVAFTLLLLLYFASGTCYAYFFSNFRKSNLGCLSIFLFFNWTMSFITIALINMVNPEGSTNISTRRRNMHLLIILCSINPHCAACYGLQEYALVGLIQERCRACHSTTAMQQFCKEYDFVQSYPYYKFDFRNPLTILALDTLFYSLILPFLRRGLSYICNFRCSINRDATGTEDSDVAQEQINITESRSYTGESSKLLIVDGLEKRISKSFTVRNVGFTVSAGECFGLLGTNGAGKTTTIRMLSGDIFPHRGDAIIVRHSLVKEKYKYLSLIGYCPQKGGIIHSLTGEEMLKLFASLRGIESKEIHLHVNYWLNVLGLYEFKKCLCGTYSGGNKRKLSTAIALIGDPAVVFLDEPTSGADPVSRRNLWSALARVQKAGQAIVLTTHNMEECEALCNRLTIMVHGSMKCIGNMQYLKQKYGLGFTILIKVSSDPTLLRGLDQLKQAVVEKFGQESSLQYEPTGLLHYYIVNPDLSLSKLCAGMNELKASHLLVEGFSISDTTLEQVFIDFAKQVKKDKKKRPQQGQL